MIAELLKEQVRTFGPNVLNDGAGGQSRVFDVGDIPPGGSLYTRNVRFGRTSVTCRYGIESPLFNRADNHGLNPTTGLAPHSCIADLHILTPTPNGERYFYTDPDDNRCIDIYFKDLLKAKHLVSGTSAVQGFAVEQVGITAIIAGYDASLNAAFDPIRVNISESPADLDDLQQEPVFPANPPIISATPSSEDTGGFVTTGTHSIGYVFRTRFGTYTKPVIVGPVTVGGGDTGRVGMTIVPNGPWPAYYAAAFIIMTSSTDSTMFRLIASSEQAVPVGTTTNIVWDAAGSTGVVDADTTLESYTDVTNWFSYIRADDETGVVPIQPFWVTNFGDRTVYLVQRVAGTSAAQVLVSDPNDPSSVSADLHTLFLPTSEKLTAAFEVGGLLVICTDTTTRTYVDSTGTPSEWPNPNIISRTLAAVGPQAVVTNDNGIGAYMMTRDGNVFYYDTAGFSRRPLSDLIYENRFDAQVDPAAKLTLDPRENILYCCFADATDVALNASPGAARKDRKKCMIFDVGGGVDPEAIRLSEWQIGSGSTQVWINKAVINTNVFQYSGSRGVIFALGHETFSDHDKCAIGITTVYQGTTPNVARDRIRFIDDDATAYYIGMKGSYHTGYFPSQTVNTGDILLHLGLFFGFRGVCSVNISVKPLNDSDSYHLHSVNANYDNLGGSGIWGSFVWGIGVWGGLKFLNKAPTKSYRRLYRRTAEKVAYLFEFETDPADSNSFFQLTEITHLYLPWAERR